jgi:hypothetical protein
VIGTEFDAAEYHTFVKYLGACADDGQIADAPIEDEFGWHPRIDAREDSREWTLLVSEGDAALDRLMWGCVTLPLTQRRLPAISSFSA